MRNIEQINQIKSRISDPYCIENFLSQEEVEHLINLYKGNTSKIKKNTGPITLNLQLCMDQVVKNILTRISSIIGDYEITAALFFETDYPHIIHNDDTFELPIGVYKAITLPLVAEGNFTEYPKLCFFDQFYFHGPAKFFNGETLIPTYFNKCVYSYEDVDNLVNSRIVDTNNLFTHLKPKWLEGLSLHSTLSWTPTSALVFDSVRLHCASDFRQQGISRKLGLSIFTKVV